MFKLAIVGLDTSHAIKFTELIQGEKRIVETLQVTRCLRFPSAFQSEEDQNKRQEILEQLGVVVTHSFEEAVKEVNGILLEINDPALHLEYFEKVSELGLPVFLDKPLADNLKNGLKIFNLAKEKELKVWSSSSLRFTPEIRSCVAEISSPVFCNVYGPLGKAASGNSLIWYGVHTFEMLMALMGKGARSVFAREDNSGTVAIVDYDDNRRGIVECNSDAFFYGGRAQNSKGVSSFTVNFANAAELYACLITALEDFFINGTIPVSFADTLEIQAMMEATLKSQVSGRTETIFKLSLVTA